MPFAYVVHCACDTDATLQRFLAWLTQGHVADVCDAGHASAEVVVLDGDGHRVEVRYRFASREDFARYERDHAPRLRQDGLVRFPTGVTFERRAGEVTFERSRG